MGNPRFEPLVGLIDGVNTVYTVSAPYSPGTIAVFFNGLLQERLLVDGYEEEDAAAGIVRMREPPEPSSLGDDVLQAFFLDTARPVPEMVMCKVTAVIKCQTTKYKAKLSDPVRYTAIIRTCSR